jgi:pyruvate,orthophosphate dikinase
MMVLKKIILQYKTLIFLYLFLQLGISAGYGVATGHLAFSLSKVEEIIDRGDKAIYCHEDISVSRDDIFATKLADGVFSLNGNMVSDVAVLCRGLAKPCVTGVNDLDFVKKFEQFVTEEKFVDENNEINKGKYLLGNNSGTEIVLKENDLITIDGSLGKIFSGVPKIVYGYTNYEFQKVISWTDKFRKIKVYGNINCYDDFEILKNLNPDGIGCLSTDFLITESLESSQLMINYFLNDSKIEKTQILGKLLDNHKLALKNIFSCFPNKKIFVKLFDMLVKLFSL